MKTFIAAAAGVLCAVYAHAQAPYLVTDINTSFTPSAQSSNPKSFTASGPSVYFAATGATTGTELYKTDGATVQLVKDLRPGTASSTPTSLVDLGNGSFVFSAIDDANGRELWISDGSEAGTVPVKDIFPGTTSSAAAPLLAIGGKAFLLASTSAGLGLWITDGQEAGTQQLALVAPGPFRSAVIGSILYYSSGDSLWRSDGTPGGTYIVKSDLYARAIVATADKIFLAAWDQTHGYELWKSDGTEVGTTIVKDINPGAGGSFNSSSISMAVVNTTVVFFASDGEHDLSLWRSDGTESGTVLYHEFDLPPTTLAPPLVVAANVGFFALNSSLWRTDATDAGTFSLAAVANPYSFVATPTTLYFLGRDESIGFRLWKSDGTDLGTVEIAPDQSVAEADPQMRYANGKLYFSGTTGLTGNEPWTSDGTTAGTVMLANLMSDPPASANPIDLHASNGRLFFVANDGTPPWQLWRSDGTAPSTLQLTDFADTGYTTLDAPTAWNGQLFFRRAFNELWKSDGTVAGTTLLKEISVWTLFSTSNYLYFTAYASSPYYTYQLWRTDGTVAGTLKITDTNYYATPVGEIAGRFYFLSNGTLWRTEGTAATTVAVGNIGYYAQSPIVMGGAIYYSGAGDYPNYELWKTDGTPEGASLVKEIRPAGSASNPRNLTPAGSLLFFTADNGTTGEELWRSDGTEEGTFLLKDILPGAGSSTPTNMVAINGILYFVANNGVDGSELWKSDGTVAGTVLVADIAPGGLSSAPNQLAGADGKLWFTASTTANGAELWTSDGTPGGTSMVADIAPGAVSSSPRELTAAGRRLYFSAETSLGRELWAMPLAATAFSISDARILEQDSGTQPMRFTVTRSGDLSQAATVAFTTAGATATAGADFVAQSGTASFAIGAATAFIDVQVAGDNLIERNESFFVNLSAPSSGVLERNVGAGMIEDDDRTSAVNVVLLQDTSFNGYRRIVVTNAGPSSATSVELRYIESPRNPTFYSYSNNCVTVPGGGSVTCSLGTLLPGENRTISLSRNYDYYLYYDPENPPGATGTATVSAAEFDPNMADNTTARMFSDNGGLMTPAFFVTNTTASADYIRSSSSSPLAVTLSSTNPVVVPSPATVTIPAGQFGTTFSLLVGNTPGKTKLTTTTNSNPSNVMVIPIVGPGVTAKLDVVFWRPSSYYSYEYGDDVPFQVKVLARAADGSLPTGIVELLDEVGDVITQQALDATGSVTFLRTGLLPGNYVYGAHYVGDAKFNPLTFTFPAIFVSGWNTYTSVIVPRVVCGNLLDVMVTVSTTDTTQNPTGQVRIVAGGQETLLNLVPAEPGKSTATTQISLPQSYYYIDAYYQPTGTFEGSSNYNYLPSVGNCTPISLSATATATNRVSLTWNNTGAASYEIHRSDSNYGFQIVGYATTNSYLDTTAQPNQTYLYRIRPNIGQLSEPEIATTYFFGNDPLVPNVTNIKALHFTQLRTATNFARTTARLPQSASIATAPAAGVAILPAHIMELRAAVNEARRYLGLLPVTFTNPTITTGMQIKAVHIQELRNALK